jgi:hypothetical protein
VVNRKGNICGLELSPWGLRSVDQRAETNYHSTMSWRPWKTTDFLFFFLLCNCKFTINYQNNTGAVSNVTFYVTICNIRTRKLTMIPYTDLMKNRLFVDV